MKDDDVREDTMQELLAENDLDDLQRMRQEMQDLLENTGDERDASLLRYRIDLIEGAIERCEER